MWFHRQLLVLHSMYLFIFKKNYFNVMHWFPGCCASVYPVEHDCAVKKQTNKKTTEGHSTVGNLVVWIHLCFYFFFVPLPCGGSTQRIIKGFSFLPQSDWCSFSVAMGSYHSQGLCVYLQEREKPWRTLCCLSSHLSLCCHLAGCFVLMWSRGFSHPVL